MIVKENGSFETCSIYPNTNWYPNQNNYIIDETTEDGKIMCKKYIDNFPFVNFEFGSNKFINKVNILEKPIKPNEVEGKSIDLIRNGLGEWEYIYVDIPKTQEEIQQDTINMLGQELVNLKIQILMGGM